MVVLRQRPGAIRWMAFGFGAFVMPLMPTSIGYQDIAALLARQPGVAEHYREHMLASFGAVRVATFHFPRPIGTEIAEPLNYRLASLEQRGIDVTGSLSITLAPPLPRRRPLPPLLYPRVERKAKGDRLVAPAPAPLPAGAVEPANSSGSVTPSPHRAITRPRVASEGTEILDPELEAALKDVPLPNYDVALSLELHQPSGVQVRPEERSHADRAMTFDLASNDNFAIQTTRLFFGSGPMSAGRERLEEWQAGEAPMLIAPSAMPTTIDPDLKSSALLPGATNGPASGESVAGKGHVTAAHHLKTPAERLKLDSKARVKAEKCLTDAVYFEARGEPVRGQMAVAQVVLNRVFSGYYPTTVCGVVYQNARRHLACQFTFACDDVPDKVDEPEAWDRAKKIAKAALDGRFWLPEVAKSTHYHAYWVRPSWVHEMRRMYRLGVHTFYRPRNWGDGSDAPTWGSAANTAALAAKL